MGRGLRRRASEDDAIDNNAPYPGPELFGPPLEHGHAMPNGAAPATLTGSPSAVTTRLRLGEVLTQRRKVTSAQVEEALLQQQASGKRLGALLVELGMVTEREVVDALSEQMGIPSVDLRQSQPEADAVGRIPESVARSMNVIPVGRLDGRLVVAAADPLDTKVIDAVSLAVMPEPYLLAIAAPSDILRSINTSYRALAGAGSLVEAFEAAESLRKIEVGARVVSDDAPIVHLVNMIVTQGLRDRASDIHIEPQGGRVRVRFRIDGALHDVLALPESMGPALVSRVKIMAKMNIVERRRPQDGQMATEIDGRPVDIRVATSPNIWGEKAVLRLLDRDRTLYRLDELGMPAPTYERFSRMLRSPYGMMICGGPTGSGKTTTLYATLGQMNQSERNITTIEDPVEYMFSSINQIQINDQAGISFATGLRAILRQDPDVILVGEIRDVETARIAVESALTGHFVMSSIHATDACSALQRFVDMGLESFLIASTVTGVVSQRLVRRICDQCRERYEPGVEELAFYHAAGGEPGSTEFWQGRGCNFCSRTGYQERIGVFELLSMDDAIKKLLIGGASVDLLRAAARDSGMETLLTGGVRLVDEGVTTIAEIMSSVYVL